MLAVARQALKTPVGARALQSILGKALRKVLYRAPEMKGLKRVVINEDVILNGAEAMYEVEGTSADDGLPEVES